MTSKRMRVTAAACAWLLVAGVAPGMAAAAQTRAADLDELQQRVDAVAAAIEEVRGTDAARADRLQDELEDLASEVVYLRVKLKKEGELATAEVEDVRTRIAELERRTKGEQVTRDAPRSTGAHTVPVGQEVDVRLQTRLSSETAQVEDRFEATTLVDLSHADELLIPAGSVMGGVVRTVDRATRTDRRGRLTLAFDRLEIDGETYRIRATVTDALESEGIRGEAGRVTAGAVAGAIIGGILGGGRGALAGLVIGGGGTIMAVPGEDVTLDAGTILRARFDSPVAITPQSPE